MRDINDVELDQVAGGCPCGGGCGGPPPTPNGGPGQYNHPGWMGHDAPFVMNGQVMAPGFTDGCGNYVPYHSPLSH